MNIENALDELLALARDGSAKAVPQLAEKRSDFLRAVGSQADPRISDAMLDKWDRLEQAARAITVSQPAQMTAAAATLDMARQAFGAEVRIALGLGNQGAEQVRTKGKTR
jgi:hypothetical protein